MLSWPCLWVGVCLVIVCMCVYYEYCCKVERGFCVIRRFVFLYSCQIVVYNHKSFALKTWNVTLSLKTWQLVTSTEILVKLESLWVNCQQNANDLPLLTSWNFDVMWHKEKKREQENKKLARWPIRWPNFSAWYQADLSQWPENFIEWINHMYAQ